jgi:L-threonylcarbamoyladenylate synthase
MKVYYWDGKEAQIKLKSTLNCHDIAVVSTDTVLGLLATATEQSFTKLNDIKMIKENRPYLILIRSHNNLKHFIDVNILDDNLTKFIKTCWPGPLTIVFKAKPNIPKFMISKHNTIALRCPNHKGLLDLLKNYAGLLSTSANTSGHTIPKNYRDVEETISNKIDCIVTNKNNKDLDSKPSTIIDFSTNINKTRSCRTSKACIRVVREGAYPIQELEKIYGSKFQK